MGAGDHHAWRMPSHANLVRSTRCAGEFAVASVTYACCSASSVAVAGLQDGDDRLVCGD